MSEKERILKKFYHEAFDIMVEIGDIIAWEHCNTKRKQAGRVVLINVCPGPFDGICHTHCSSKVYLKTNACTGHSMDSSPCMNDNLIYLQVLKRAEKEIVNKVAVV